MGVGSAPLPPSATGLFHTAILYHGRGGRKRFSSLTGFRRCVAWTLLRKVGLVSRDSHGAEHLATTSGLTASAASMHIRVLKKTVIIEQGMGCLYRLTPAYRPSPGQDYVKLGPRRLMLLPTV